MKPAIIVQTPTPSAEASRKFYGDLGFQCLREETPAVFRDAELLVEIVEERTARAGFKLFAPDWSDAVGRLRQDVHVLDKPYGHLLSDPSGAWIYLHRGEPTHPERPDQEHRSLLGKFAGISLETIDIARSARIWETLGFRKGMGDAEQGWVTYTHPDGVGVSLMAPDCCPHLFFTPSLTYFNGGKNEPVIQSIREVGVPITEEITHFNKEGIVDNVIIRDPGGLGMFIFND